MTAINQMYRLKVAYQAENESSGEIEKIKEEILVECVNYTNAETLLNKLIETYSMNKLCPAVYEIIKCKFAADDIYINSLVDCDDDTTPLTYGRLNCFFKDESHGLYVVDAIIFGDKEAKEKDEKRAFLIPAIDPAYATMCAKAILDYDGHKAEDISVTNVKYDKAGNFYLDPMTFNNLSERSEKIFKNYGL